MTRVKLTPQAHAELVGEAEQAPKFIPPPWAIPDPGPGPGTTDEQMRVYCAAKALSDATEQMNKLIQVAEAKFAALNLGVPGMVKLYDDGDGWETFLRFSKEGKEWRLMLCVGPENEQEFAEENPLLNASRENRERALKSLPELYADLIKRAEENADRLAKTVTATAAFLQGVGAK